MARYSFNGDDVDLNVINVVQKIFERSRVRKEKYGVDTTRQDFSPLDWLSNLQEELCDAIIYIESFKRSNL